MPVIIHCPYYQNDYASERRFVCEGNVRRFPDARSRLDYIGKYCGSSAGWKDCTICQSLNEYYERTLK